MRRSARDPARARAGDRDTKPADDEAAPITAESTVVAQLEPELQRQLVAQVSEVWRHAPPVRPSLPNGTPMRVTVSAAGELCWWSDAKGGYRYIPRHPRGQAWPSIPETWLELWRRFSGRPDLRPDCALVNWYGPGEALGWHADTTEQDRTLPVVTISLGDAASWAVREREGAPVSRCRLESGAVTLLAGPSRLLEHTIERIIPADLFSPIPGGKRGRLSITMRVAGSPRAAASIVAEPPPMPARALTADRQQEILVELRGRTAAILAEARGA